MLYLSGNSECTWANCMFSALRKTGYLIELISTKSIWSKNPNLDGDAGKSDQEDAIVGSAILRYLGCFEDRMLSCHKTIAI